MQMYNDCNSSFINYITYGSLTRDVIFSH
jgi:hypothetical protein